MIFGELENGSGYAFNNSQPSGVRYLSKEYYQALINHINNIPINEGVTLELAKAGLSMEPGSTQVSSTIKKSKAFTVWFHVSNDCNLSCSYCYIPNLKKGVRDEAYAHQAIDTDLGRETIVQLLKFCKSSGFETLQIKFAGGEPLLAITRIEQLCEFASIESAKYGVRVSFRMLTNGVLVSERAIDILLKYKFGVSISVDGGESEHDRIRFVVDKSVRDAESKLVLRQGTWKTIGNNINKLICYGIKPYLLCTVTLENHGSLKDVADLCSSKSIGFRLSLVRDKNSSMDILRQESVLESLVELYEYLGERLPVTMPLERFARFGEWDLSKKKAKVCGVCSSTACVDNYGEVSTCQMNMSVKYGVAKEETTFGQLFNEMRNDQNNQYLAKPETKTGSCNSCEWKYVCAGGCPEHTRKVFNEIDRPSPWCRVYKGLLPVYVRAVAKQIKRAVVLGKDADNNLNQPSE